MGTSFGYFFFGNIYIVLLYSLARLSLSQRKMQHLCKIFNVNVTIFLTHVWIFTKKSGWLLTGFSHFDGKEYSVNQKYYLNLYITKKSFKKTTFRTVWTVETECGAFFWRLQILPTLQKTNNTGIIWLQNIKRKLYPETLTK